MVDFALLDGTHSPHMTPQPVNTPAGGAYAKAMSSSLMAAGLGGASPIFSFRFVPAAPVSLCLVRQVLISAAVDATAFTAGAGRFDMFAARAFSASDSAGTAGTLTGNNAKLRTSMQTTGVADFRISSTATLTAGTRTLDTDPMGSIQFPAPATAGAVMVPPNSILFQNKSIEYPFALATSEGFVVQATVPATGTWRFSVAVVWDEVEKF